MKERAGDEARRGGDGNEAGISCGYLRGVERAEFEVDMVAGGMP